MLTHIAPQLYEITMQWVSMGPTFYHTTQAIHSYEVQSQLRCPTSSRAELITSQTLKVPYLLCCRKPQFKASKEKPYVNGSAFQTNSGTSKACNSVELMHPVHNANTEINGYSRFK